MYKKRIVFNRYYLILIIGIPVIVFLSYFFSIIYPALDTLMGPAEYYAEKNYTLKAHRIVEVFSWTSFLSSSWVLQLIYPAFLLSGLLHFKEELGTFFQLSKTRFKSFHYSIFKTAIGYSLMISISFMIGHALCFIIFWFITPAKTDGFTDLAPQMYEFMITQSFFANKPLLFFLSSILWNDFPVFFSFSLMYSMLTLFTYKKNYLYIAIPIFISIGIPYLLSSLNFPYLGLAVPLSGVLSQLSIVWKYCVIPLIVSVTLFTIFVKLGENKVFET